MKDERKPKNEIKAPVTNKEAESLEKELQELIEEGETRTEAYRKIMKEIEKGINKSQD